MFTPTYITLFREIKILENENNGAFTKPCPVQKPPLGCPESCAVPPSSWP